MTPGKHFYRRYPNLACGNRPRMLLLYRSNHVVGDIDSSCSDWRMNEIAHVRGEKCIIVGHFFPIIRQPLYPSRRERNVIALGQG